MSNQSLSTKPKAWIGAQVVADPVGACREIRRLRQFIRNAAEHCNCAETIVDMRAALGGEYLYQQLPGWNKERPFERPMSDSDALRIARGLLSDEASGEQK